MNRSQFDAGLLAFLDAARSPFHAANLVTQLLAAAGFEALDERAQWDLRVDGKYCVVRNDSSLIAFRMAGDQWVQHGLRMAGAHTDSPCLRLKPNAILQGRGYTRLGLEVYGGTLLNPWFDRDLSVAGRVHVRTSTGNLQGRLIDFDRPVAFIPSLAIHLDREANQKRSINSQTDIPALLGQSDVNLRALLKAELLKAELQADAKMEVLDFELCLYDCQPSRVIGLNSEFIASARLDNLVSCYAAAQALVHADDSSPALIVLNDHEEVGSTTADGAQGAFLEQVLARLMPDPQDRARCIASSVLVSADNAHGVHPNYPDKHDDRHGPLLNAGPVLKVNANQRYASTSETQAFLRHAAERSGVPLQVFVTRADMACGSTIGPLTAARIGVRTVDVGIPQLGMHSVRELCGADDPHALFRLLQGCFQAA